MLLSQQVERPNRIADYLRERTRQLVSLTAGTSQSDSADLLRSRTGAGEGDRRCHASSVKPGLWPSLMTSMKRVFCWTGASTFTRPDLVRVEFANTIWKKVRRKEITDAKPYLKELRRLARWRSASCPPTEQYAHRACCFECQIALEIDASGLRLNLDGALPAPKPRTQP